MVIVHLCRERACGCDDCHLINPGGDQETKTRLKESGAAEKVLQEDSHPVSPYATVIYFNEVVTGMYWNVDVELFIVGNESVCRCTAGDGESHDNGGIEAPSPLSRPPTLS